MAIKNHCFQDANLNRFFSTSARPAPSADHRRSVRVAVVPPDGSSADTRRHDFRGLIFQLQQQLYDICGINVEYATHRELSYQATLSCPPNKAAVRVAHLVALPKTETEVEALAHDGAAVYAGTRWSLQTDGFVAGDPLRCGDEGSEDKGSLLTRTSSATTRTVTTTSPSRFSVQFDYGKYLYGGSSDGEVSGSGGNVSATSGSAAQSLADYFVFLVPDDLTFGENAGYLAQSGSLAGVYVLSRAEVEQEVERVLNNVSVSISAKDSTNSSKDGISNTNDVQDVHDSDILNRIALTRKIELDLHLGRSKSSNISSSDGDESSSPNKRFEDNYISFSFMGHHMEAQEALKQRVVEKFQL